MSLFSAAEFSFEIVAFKNISFMNTSRVSNSVIPDNARCFSLI